MKTRNRNTCRHLVVKYIKPVYNDLKHIRSIKNIDTISFLQKKIYSGHLRSQNIRNTGCVLGFTRKALPGTLNRNTNNWWTRRRIIIIMFYYIKNIQQQCVMMHEKVKRNPSKVNPLDTLLLSTTVMFKA